MLTRYLCQYCAFDVKFLVKYFLVSYDFRNWFAPRNYQRKALEHRQRIFNQSAIFPPWRKEVNKNSLVWDFNTANSDPRKNLSGIDFQLTSKLWNGIMFSYHSYIFYGFLMLFNYFFVTDAHSSRGDGERYVTPARAAAKETTLM